MRTATAGPLDGPRFFVQRGGIGFAARVTITLEPAPAGPIVDLACTGDGWSGQGSIEDVGPRGHDAWKAGARAGVAFALRIAGGRETRVCITRILGMTSDTNPTLVAAAAARAVWIAFEFTPPPALLAALDRRVLASWDREPDAPPDLDLA